jgi:hypothetical protein
MDIWQHSDLVQERQGCRIAHPEKPVLGKGYVEDTCAARDASNLRHIQGSDGRRSIVLQCGLHKRGKCQIFCHRTRWISPTVQGMADH